MGSDGGGGGGGDGENVRRSGVTTDHVIVKMCVSEAEVWRQRNDEQRHVWWLCVLHRDV